MDVYNAALTYAMTKSGGTNKIQNTLLMSKRMDFALITYK